MSESADFHREKEDDHLQASGIRNARRGDTRFGSPCIRYKIRNAEEIDARLSQSSKLRLRLALAIVARVMGNLDEISAMQLKELINPLNATSNKFSGILSVLGLRFASAADQLDSRFRLGPRPTVEVAEDDIVYELLLQDAMTWNWTLDKEGPWIFWMVRFEPRDMTALGGKSHVVFVKQPNDSQFLSKEFSPPTLRSLGNTSCESILSTDKVIPIRAQTTAQMKACYDKLLSLIKNGMIDLEKTRTIASFLAPIRTTKIRTIQTSGGNVEQLNALYYSLALFLDQVRMNLGDPKFKDSKMSEHLVRLRELGQASQDQAVKTWCGNLLDFQERLLLCDSTQERIPIDGVKIDFLSLSDLTDALNRLRMRTEGLAIARRALDTAEIMGIIRQNHPDLTFPKAMRKYASFAVLGF